MIEHDAKICRDCAGSGLSGDDDYDDDSAPVFCESCEGTGYIEITRNKPDKAKKKDSSS